MNPDNNTCILVVDDETHILHIVSMKLRNAGYDVVTAEDGEEGWEKAVEHRPALIITDYQMPLLTGLELCQKLKTNDHTKDIPALMLTARGFSLNDQQLEGTNIVAVLSKPFSPRDVLQRVQALTEGEHKVEAETVR
jgi:CheY-like chemotaxis protein